MPERSCQGCTKQLEWGCETPPPIPIMFDGDEYLTRCPRRPFLEDPKWFDEIYTAQGWISKGFLPVAGTYGDMPNKLAQCLKVIEQVQHEVDQETARKRNITANTPPPKTQQGPPRNVRR